MGRQTPPLEGKQFYKLYVQGRAGRDAGGSVLWRCICECGAEKLAYTNQLTGGRLKSCGQCIGKGWRRLPDGEAGRNFLYKQYRAKAASRGYGFDLTLEEFTLLTTQPCHYCGTPPSYVQSVPGSDSHADYVYNGIDRIDNDDGYSWDNCLPCCGVCNLAKREMSYSDFIAWLDRLVAYRTRF